MSIWQRETTGVSHRSLEGMHSTVEVPAAEEGFWKQWRAFVGPAFLVSVGYMDPGNWGTDLQAGASYKYGLLWVVALASLMAIVMQILSARLGVVTGKDLAQACRDFYPAWTRWPTWPRWSAAPSRSTCYSAFPSSGRCSSPPSTCCCCWPCRAWGCALSRRSSWSWSRPSAFATSSRFLSCRRRTPTFWKWAGRWP